MNFFPPEKKKIALTTITRKISITNSTNSGDVSRKHNPNSQNVSENPKITNPSICDAFLPVIGIMTISAMIRAVASHT